ncbi:hypothetical protein ACFQ1M_13815 [Sungkyunkwania multivorans]|uniref:Metal-dependent HD superfamily phosphohydrolase n=1 Tax=Sungkyunkwania multivorans TaxID=1173618 RepID=A0ABW3CZN6_9FLAO
MSFDLQDQWTTLATHFTNDGTFVVTLWEEIEAAYSHKSRHYHNLAHIESMLKQANEQKHQLIDVPEVLLAIWYHDIIYKATRQDNEEKSAVFAKNRLKILGLQQEKIEKCSKLIISTKRHETLFLQDSDNQWLLDFDLSILGSNWETYQRYVGQIRKEYHIYPDFIYKKGRKKVLQQFLERKRLYFTDMYFERLEEKARLNIERELELLS